MQKNEFEKQVQQKMDELRLHPSDSVWSNIQGHISKRKRPKLAWIFFPTLIICLGIGYWLMNLENTLTPVQKTNISKNVIEKDSVSTAQLSNNISDEKDSHSEKKNSNLNNDTKIDIVKNQAKKIFSAPAENENSSKETNTNTVVNKLMQEKKNTSDPIISKVEITEPAQDQNLMPMAKENFNAKNKIPGEINNTGIANNEDTLTSKDEIPVNIFKDTTKQMEAEMIAQNGKQLKTQNPNKFKKPWKWGLNFSVGVSGVPNKFLGSLDKSFASADALYSSSPPPNNLAPLPSKITSSTALVAGVVIEKNISKKISIVTGLNYKMFSTTNKVGARDNSSQRYSLNNAVSSYHNSYHFIELPVSFKIGSNSKKLPLFLDAGISISRLISSNALQFNSTYILYDRDNSLFNKSQIGLNTGFYTSLFTSKHTSIQVGPHMYYGTTKAAEQGLYKNQHFTFIGLKTQIFFKK